jgi:hypothetical protein
MTFLHVDSRHRRPGTSHYNADFNLVRPLRGVRRARVKSVQFVNTFFNITSQNNTLSTSAGSVMVLPVGYLPANDFVTALNAALVVAFGTGSYATLDAVTNEIDWILGINTVDGSSPMADLLGLNNNNAALTGSFSSTLHLARPQYLSWSCSQLQSTGSVHTGVNPQDGLQPFAVIPVTSAYLSAQTYEPTVERELVLDSGRNGRTISQLSFRIQDPSSGRDITELSSWAAVIEFQ